jgi:hypothetical protein
MFRDRGAESGGGRHWRYVRSVCAAQCAQSRYPEADEHDAENRHYQPTWDGERGFHSNAGFDVVIIDGTCDPSERNVEKIAFVKAFAFAKRGAGEGKRAHDVVAMRIVRRVKIVELAINLVATFELFEVRVRDIFDDSKHV